MTRYLLDTNHLGQAAARESPLLERIKQARMRGHRFGTCIPVLCEIEAGAQQVADPDAYRQHLERSLRMISVWPLDRTTARIYGDLYNDLRSRGRHLSQVDMMAAALARQLELVVLTTDRDFEALPEIRTENWLAG